MQNCGISIVNAIDYPILHSAIDILQIYSNSKMIFPGFLTLCNELPAVEGPFMRGSGLVGAKPLLCGCDVGTADPAGGDALLLSCAIVGLTGEGAVTKPVEGTTLLAEEVAAVEDVETLLLPMLLLVPAVTNTDTLNHWTQGDLNQILDK